MFQILIKKNKYSKFSYCYSGLGAGCSTKEATTASFIENFNENQENTTQVYFAVGKKNIMLKQILYGSMNSCFSVDIIATNSAMTSQNGEITKKNSNVT